MAKKSGGGSAALVLLVIVIAALASLPKPLLVILGLLAVAAGVVVYFAVRNANAEVPPKAQTTTQRDTTKGSPAPARAAGIAQTRTAREPAFVPFPASTHVGQPHRDAPPLRAQQNPSSPEPVAVSQPEAGQSNSFKLPAAPANYGAAKWIGPGETFDLSSLTIPGGLVYVGTRLPTRSGTPDPCLLDPSVRVAVRGDYCDRHDMSYWPSYSTVSAEARRAYLKWLADGRRDPTADIGYVFLFFYGLERRAIVDGHTDDANGAAARADVPAILAEVRRLLGIYGELNSSFRRYASDFLSLLEGTAYAGKLYDLPLPDLPQGQHELPLYLRLALGQCALDRAPVPSDLALAWVRLDPNINLRTAASRCPEQFDQLFEQRYLEKYGHGLELPRNKTKLKFVYRAASASLHEYGEIKLSFGDVPDVAVLTAPVTKLRELADAVTGELDSYSRYLGKSPTGVGKLDGLLLLPPTLWPADAQERMKSLGSRMLKGMVVLRLEELAATLGQVTSLERSMVMSLARTLEAANIAMEPDVLSGAKTPKPDDKVVLFAVQPDDLANRTGPAYQAAALTLQLATAVAMADGDISGEELRHLRHQIESWSHLTPAHQQRLRAHMRLLMDAPPSLTVLKKKLEPLAVPAKEAIAHFMAVIAQADGAVSPAEIKMLEKVYKALGVDPQKVFSHVHAVAAAAPAVPARMFTKPDAAAPTPAPTTAPATPAETVPAPAAKAAAAGFQLDAARIAALQQETDKVSAVLSNIFTEEAEPAAPQVAAAEPADEPAAPVGLMGLDAAHTAFVHQLVSRPEWTREELLDLASDLDLMLDGALERINEAAFDAHDCPLTEGDDPVTINREILESETA